jgi:hypothetical protein
MDTPIEIEYADVLLNIADKIRCLPVNYGLDDRDVDMLREISNYLLDSILPQWVGSNDEGGSK